jgi:hypothetical protein
MQSPLLQPADVVIYRKSNGGAYVVPSVFTVSKPFKLNVVFANFTNDVIRITVDHLPELSVNANSKESLDIKDLPRGIYDYDVKIGKDFAAGNSSPVIIVDE